MKFRFLLILLCLMITLLFVSCLKTEINDGVIPVNDVQICVSELSGYYELEDYTNLGKWVFTILQDDLVKQFKESPAYSLVINQHIYPLKQHKVIPGLMIAFPDDKFEKNDIQNAVIKTKKDLSSRTTPDEAEISVEKVIIRRDDSENGTDLYEISVEDYLQLKADNTSIVFSGGSLLRPSYVISCEGNAYPIKTYYDARQAAAGNKSYAAFEFLKKRPEHSTLLFLGNPNIVSVDGEGSINIGTPDERDRLRQIGSEGELNGSHAFQIIRDDYNKGYIVRIDRNILIRNQKYDKTYCYDITLNSATNCMLRQTGQNIYETYIAYTEQAGMELIRNSRFFGDLKLGVYSYTGEKTGAYNSMSEAVGNTYNGERIIVNGPVIFNENAQSYVVDRELIITSKNSYPFILDYTASATRAFMVSGGASLTIENAIVQNVNITDIGAAFFVTDDTESLTIKDSIIGTNTSEDFGGALALYGGNILIDGCTLTNNTVIGGVGNGGAVYNNTLCTIKNSFISENNASSRGGAVYNQRELNFYDNEISSNTADINGNGLYIHDNAIVYNSHAQQWRHFQSPHTAIQIVENSETAENIYSDQGFSEGDCISVQLAKETMAGTVNITPSTSTEFESKLIQIVYETGDFYYQGSVTINIPSGFDITGNSSVTIGTDEAIEASAYTYDSQRITIDNLNVGSGTIIKLTILNSVPSGYSEPIQARNIYYPFAVVADADGNGRAWSESVESTANFESFNYSICTDFRIKTGYDYLKLVTDEATQIHYDLNTAEQTTVASITEAIESTDGSVQSYRIDSAAGLLSPGDVLPVEATLTVTARHGNIMQFIIARESGDFKLIRTDGSYNLFKTLTKAVAAVNDGQEYTIECSSTSEIFEPEIIIDSNKEITIRPSGNLTTFTMNGGETHRVLTISANASVTLKSVVIKKGATLSDGGGIYFTGKNLYLENCSVENNYSGLNGGGIYFGGGKLTLLNTDIKYNRCGSNGGGIYMTCLTGMADLHFDSGAVFDNSAFMGKGGGIFGYNGYIYTGYGCWNGPPNDMWGEYNRYFSVGIDGRYHEYDLSHPAKLYNNYANEGSQLYI